MDENTDTIVSFERIIEVESPQDKMVADSYILHMKFAVYTFIITNILAFFFLILPLGLQVWSNTIKKLKRVG